MRISHQDGKSDAKVGGTGKCSRKQENSVCEKERSTTFLPIGLFQRCSTFKSRQNRLFKETTK